MRLAAGATVVVPSARLPARSGPVRVGVRPERLHIRPAEESDRDPAVNTLDASVNVSTYIGVSTSYECSTSDGARVVVYVQNLDGAASSIGAGQHVRLSWESEHTFAAAKSDVREGDWDE